MKTFRTFLVSTVVLLLCGCGLHQFEPMNLTLSPRLSLAPSTIGSGSKVYVSVVDRLPDKRIGHRTYDWFAEKWAGEITLTHDVGPVLSESLRNGLSSLGFEVLNAPASSLSILEVTVENLVFKGLDIRRRDFWPTRYISVVGKAAIHKDAAKTFDKPYRLLHKWESHFGFAPDEIQEEINKIVSDFLMTIFEDSELITKLK